MIIRLICLLVLLLCALYCASWQTIHCVALVCFCLAFLWKQGLILHHFDTDPSIRTSLMWELSVEPVLRCRVMRPLSLSIIAAIVRWPLNGMFKVSIGLPYAKLVGQRNWVAHCLMVFLHALEVLRYLCPLSLVDVGVGRLVVVCLRWRSCSFGQTTSMLQRALSWWFHLCLNLLIVSHSFHCFLA